MGKKLQLTRVYKNHLINEKSDGAIKGEALNSSIGTLGFPRKIERRHAKASKIEIASRKFVF